MRRTRQWAPALAALAGLLLAACVHGPQAVRLHPELQIPDRPIGRGLPVAVQVVDARPDPTPTELPAAVRTRADFPIRDDLPGVIRERVMEGLERRGFAPQTDADGRSLTVEVRQFDYWALSGFGTADVRASAVLHAVARRGGGSFDVTYRASHHQQVAVVPRPQDVEGTVNGALTAALRQLFEDDQLLGFLAE